MKNIPNGRFLLTTPFRTKMAVGLTALVFAVAIRDELRRSHYKPLWPLFGGWPHGWLAIAVNVAFWGYFCWIAFFFIYHSRGRERIFFAGWFGFLLSPIKVLHPEWAAPVRHVETFGIALSLLVALSFLLKVRPGQLNVRDQVDD